MTLVSLIHFDSAWYAPFCHLLHNLFCAMIEGNLATPLFLGKVYVPKDAVKRVAEKSMAARIEERV